MTLTRSAALVLSVGLLAGCGGGGENPTSVKLDGSATGESGSSAAPSGGGAANGSGDGGKASSTGEPTANASGETPGSSSAPKPAGGTGAMHYYLFRSHRISSPVGKR